MCNSLEINGADIKIAIAGKEVDENWNRPYIKVPIIRRRFLRIISFWILGYLEFVRSYLTHRPDAVILDIISIWFSIPFVLFPRRKCIFIIDNRTPLYDLEFYKKIGDKIMNWYTKLSFWYCRYFLDGMTVINGYYKKQVCKQFNFNPDVVGVWGSGVNIEMFSTAKYKESKRPSFLNNKFVLMHHGGLGPRRGLLQAIEAMSLVDNKNIVLVLIGSIEPGLGIMQKIKQLGLEERVFVLKPIPFYQIPTYISYCDCAIMAYPDMEYWKNNSPIKLIEYFGMGKVVICTDIWTFRDVVKDKKCAYFIANNNPKLIADAINYCYENRASLEERGRQGEEIVKEKYTWNKLAQNLLDFIKVLQENKGYEK
jgi:glycosyltransferase involved in cell wall biosynthesis